MLFIHHILIYFILINFITIFIFWYDKYKSTQNTKTQFKSRISENTLLVFSFLSLGVGAMLAMQLFRHKTKKMSFQVKFWSIMCVEYSLAFYIFF